MALPNHDSNLNKVGVSVDKTQSCVRAAQWVPYPIHEVFHFFSDPYNLEKITPAFLKFKVAQISTPAIQEGTRLDYKLCIHGVPCRWQSVIENWQPPHLFSDRQIKGPYRYWFHKHEFQTDKGGTWIRDFVEYRLPLSWIGGLILSNWIAKDLYDIFTYRQKIIVGVFKN